ncbi:leucine--tRNA ligase [Capsulimonas corticalis]|uniref:Leucine--tRNA ligase n=1 Tax=Capsulimonas corticalis TaxID=2219043 RepID=A0A402CT77_9BACT|nr:leucine--tRNA ligase [Capsulimonas corticalis]BDI30832.1 leucine--tRNA ligase [Capsulimonas corticalis]
MALDERYNFNEIEKKWQDRWAEANLYHVEIDPSKPKYYGLEFFPYPSGAGLSVGHFKNYAPNDAFLRYKSMRGFNVLHPMGWDAFGMPAENEAINKKRQPSTMVREYAANYKRQLNLIGMGYDWDREINSSDPAYYHWTQWIFLMLNQRGLAERKNANINWCPFDKTALANEEVVNGRCQRCGTPVEKKAMPQWYLKITEYAERLLSGLDTVDWPEGIKMQQRNWIGRSEGAEVDFQAGEHTITVFTTRPDTLWGATFMVLAPEHPLVETLTTPEHTDDIAAYVARAGRLADIDRQAEGREKTGVFTGSYASNPVNGEQVPIWIADYVLTGYGTGAIMAVPAHDQRDFDFARKFDLPIIPVYQQPGEAITGESMTQATTDQGVLTNSGAFNGLAYSKATVRQVSAWLEQQGKGKPVVNYRFRDWLLSRQRYWGVPIPIIHCPEHGAVPVPEDQLPVLLPPVENYQPSGTGESPLATIPEFVNTVCPICGGAARRETDTMAGFACSSWYFLRFADPHNGSAPFSSEAAKYWLPVDTYVGGAEHAVMHLLYARFWTKVLYDAGKLEFDEPFTRLRNQGMMLAYTPGRKPELDERTSEDSSDEPIEDWVAIKPEDLPKYKPEEIVYRWAKMSKSAGNVVTPDETAAKYGADSTRVYEMFIAPFEETVQWSEDGIRGSFKFLARVYRLVAQQSEGWTPDWRARVGDLTDAKEKALRRKTHQTIVKIADDLENFRFNTSVAGLMEWVNAMYEVVNALPAGERSAALDEAIENLILILAPFAPHLADELWQVGLGQSGFLYKHAWPESDPEVAKADEITLVVQVNGKVRDKITAPAGLDNESLKAIALESERVQEHTHGKTIRNVIVVPGKLVNIVVG